MEPGPEVRAPEREEAWVEAVEEVRVEVEAGEAALQQAPGGPACAPTVVKG